MKPHIQRTFISLGYECVGIMYVIDKLVKISKTNFEIEIEENRVAKRKPF